MPVTDGDHTKEKEDDAIRQGTHCLHCILHGCVALLGNVWEGITFLCDATSNLNGKQMLESSPQSTIMKTMPYQTDDSRPVDCFCQEKSEVTHDINYQGFYDSCLFGESQEKSCEATDYNANGQATKANSKKTKESNHILADSDVALHLIGMKTILLFVLFT